MSPREVLPVLEESFLTHMVKMIYVRETQGLVLPTGSIHWEVAGRHSPLKALTRNSRLLVPFCARAPPHFTISLMLLRLPLIPVVFLPLAELLLRFFSTTLITQLSKQEEDSSLSDLNSNTVDYSACAVRGRR